VPRKGIGGGGGEGVAVGATQPAGHRRQTLGRSQQRRQRDSDAKHVNVIRAAPHGDEEPMRGHPRHPSSTGRRGGNEEIKQKKLAAGKLVRRKSGDSVPSNT
jgi:hypothetical protein